MLDSVGVLRRVLVDLMMPVVDGLDFRRALVAQPQLKDTYVVIIRAPDLTREALEARLAVSCSRNATRMAFTGWDGYLSSDLPGVLRTLRPVINSVLDNSAN